MSAAVDDERRQTCFDHRDGPVLEVRHRPSAREHVARLAELQRDLLGGREVEAAAEHDGTRARQRRDQGLDRRFPLERAGDSLRHGLEPGLERRVRADRLRDEGQGQQARGVGLRGWDADLRTRLQRQHEIGGICELGSRVVRDREREHALAPCFFEHRDHVRRLTRLRDADHALAVEAWWTSVVGEQRRRCERDEVLVPRAEEVFRVQSRVVRAAACGDQDAARPHLPNARRNRVGRFGAVGEQPGRNLRLLGDLRAEAAHRRPSSRATRARLEEPPMSRPKRVA